MAIGMYKVLVICLQLLVICGKQNVVNMSALKRT